MAVRNKTCEKSQYKIAKWGILELKGVKLLVTESVRRKLLIGQKKVTGL